MNAKEAREILEPVKNSAWPAVYSKEFQAKGYLEALEGPEVKALVEALEAILVHQKIVCPTAMDLSATCCIAKDALSQFRSATETKEEKKP